MLQPLSSEIRPSVDLFRSLISQIRLWIYMLPSSISLLRLLPGFTAG